MGDGRVVLVGTPIGNLGDLTPRAVEVLRDADVIAAEDTRRTRVLLSAAGIPAAGRLVAFHAHNEAATAARLVARAATGDTVACVSDAGMPGVSDPGERLVRAALDAGVAVTVTPGPSAVLAALVLSGLPAGRFAYEGFLPRKGRERRERLEALAVSGHTAVVFESPARLAATLADLAVACGPDRLVAVARELTKAHEEVWRGRLGDAAGAADARGEQVIVLGPAQPPPAPTPGDVEEAVGQALAAGLSARHDADRVAADLGTSRRRAYQEAIRQRQIARSPASPG